jgi:ATP-binding cassette, subfamily F, member 3
MLQVQHLRKSYGAVTVISDVSFILNDNQHVGLIGPNGVGKSTLLRCLIGAEPLDAGTIVTSPPGLAIGYLAQACGALWERRVGEAVAAARADVSQAEQTLQEAAEALATASDVDAALARYDAALAHFEALGGYEHERRTVAALQGLGLGSVDPATPVAMLSGGQKTRLGLAALLISAPDLLLLDEPTNHLDVEALAWLEGFVRGYRHTVLIVSHDREFLDRTVTRILYFDPDTHGVQSYTGNYSDFATARAHEHELQVAAWHEQQSYIQQVETDIRRVQGHAQGIQSGRDFYGRVAAKVARLAKARTRKLGRYRASDERVEKPREHWGLKLDFGPPPSGSRVVLRLEDVSFGYTSQVPLFSAVTWDVQYSQRIAIVGPNGAGKTTLLRLVAGQLPPQTGTVRLGVNVRLGVMAQEQETLDLRWTVLQTVRHERPMSETEARHFLHFFLFAGDSVFRTVGACSLGERSRLQLARLVLRGCNVLLLDEPLNHLDIEGREHFEVALEAFEGTVIAVSHDRAFLRSFAERVVEVRDGRVRLFPGGYDIVKRRENTQESAHNYPSQNHARMLTSCSMTWTGS